jgi:23S rRNA G2069 N7-methylase RlmK/C1962 C5-methylase RlmI
MERPDDEYGFDPNFSGDEFEPGTPASASSPAFGPRGLRLITPEQAAGQAVMLANRVRKRLAQFQKRFGREGIDCFRLFDRDIPEIRAVVDWYAGHLVIAEYVRKQTGPEWLPTMARAVAEMLKVPPERVHLRRRNTGQGEGPRYAPLADTRHRFEVRERDLRFWVNLDDRLDTGLFPDHRDTRVLVRKMAQGADFLNLFAYTGAFTCAAAAGGARSTTTVDRSSTYVDWARDNLELNRLAGPQNRMVRADVEDFLDRARAEGQQWNLVFVDPPSFSNRKGVDVGFDVARDHPDLLRRVLAVTAPGGIVLFSTNHQRFEPKFEGLAVASIEEITESTIPEDYRNRQIHRCWRIVAPSGSSRPRR